MSAITDRLAQMENFRTTTGVGAVVDLMRQAIMDQEDRLATLEERAPADG